MAPICAKREQTSRLATSPKCSPTTVATCRALRPCSASRASRFSVKSRNTGSADDRAREQGRADHGALRVDQRCLISEAVAAICQIKLEHLVPWSMRQLRSMHQIRSLVEACSGYRSWHAFCRVIIDKFDLGGARNYHVGERNAGRGCDE